MFGIGTWEILVIFLFVLMFYGPEQLPGVAKKLAMILKNFRKMSHEVTQVVQKELAQIERETQLKEMKEHIDSLKQGSEDMVNDVKNTLTNARSELDITEKKND